LFGVHQGSVWSLQSAVWGLLKGQSPRANSWYGPFGVFNVPFGFLGYRSGSFKFLFWVLQDPIRGSLMTHLEVLQDPV